MFWRCLILISSIGISVSQSVFAARVTVSIIDQLNEIDANVLLMRHALAPGFGDPNKFVIDQCDTQRNLDDVGRSQATLLGRQVRQAGLVFDKVYSSYWCRCIETAELLNLGAVEPFSGLNSFFQMHADRDETLKLLQKKLIGFDEKKLTLMVTHQVVIQAVSGISVVSGGIVAYNSKTGQSVRITFE
jgi:phosphohistidine phosphatase SixA